MGYAASRCAEPPAWGLPFPVHRPEAESRDQGGILPASWEEVLKDHAAFGGSIACAVMWSIFSSIYVYLQFRKNHDPKGAGLSSSSFRGLANSGQALLAAVLFLVILAVICGASVFQRLDVARCRAQLWRPFLLDGDLPLQSQRGEMQWRGLDSAHALAVLIGNELGARNLDVTIRQLSAAVNGTVLRTKQLLLDLKNSLVILTMQNASWYRHRCLFATRMREELTSLLAGLEDFLVRHLFRLQESMSGALLHPGPEKLSEYAKDLASSIDSIRRQIGTRGDQLPVDHPLEMMYSLVWWLSLALAAYGAIVVGILIWMLFVLCRIRIRFQQLLVYQERGSAEQQLQKLCGNAFTLCTCAFPVASLGFILAAFVLLVASSPRLTQVCADAEAGRLLEPLLRSNAVDSPATERFLDSCLIGNAQPRPLVKTLQSNKHFSLWDLPQPAEVQARWSPTDPMLLLELLKEADPARALRWSHFVHVDLTGFLPLDLHITSADVDSEDPPGLLSYARRLNDRWNASGQNPNVVWTFSSAPPPNVQWKPCTTVTTTATSTDTRIPKRKTSNMTNISNSTNCTGNASNSTGNSCNSSKTTQVLTTTSTTTTIGFPPWNHCGPPIVRKIAAEAPNYDEFWHLGDEMRQLFIIARQKEALRTRGFLPNQKEELPLPQFLAWHVRRANTGHTQFSAESAAIQQVLGEQGLEKSLEASMEAIQALLNRGFDCHILKQMIGEAMGTVCDDRKGAIVLLWVSGVLIMVLSIVVSIVGVLGFMIADGLREDKQAALTQETTAEARRRTSLPPVEQLF